MDAYTAAILALGGLGLVAVALIAGLIVRFYLGRRKVEQLWAARQNSPLQDIGTVKHLTILPLVDRKASRGNLACEPGVSYLIRADNTTILFDVGLNARRQHPSPLLRNMQALGVALDQVQYIVISHLHLDHVGGISHHWKHSFDLSKQPVELGPIPAIVPTAMTHPTAAIQVVEGPRVIQPGLAILGPIPQQLFLLGRTLEQSLAIDVADKGVVLVIGCAHPSIQRIVQQAEEILDRPLYGVVGGLHYPVTGLPAQRFLGTGSWPWDPVDKKDVAAGIEFLRRRHLKVVAVSPHDSCDWTLEAFRRAFPGAYHDLLVGESITV